MSRNGRPEPEVIVNFVDGFSYSKGKLEDAFKEGGVLDKPFTHPKEHSVAKREDVDYLVKEMEVTRVKAEKLLNENGGDLVKTLRVMIGLPVLAASS